MIYMHANHGDKSVIPWFSLALVHYRIVHAHEPWLYYYIFTSIQQDFDIAIIMTGTCNEHGQSADKKGL